MKPAIIDQRGNPNEADPTAAWHRFLRVGFAFLAFEAVILFLLGGPFFGDSDSTLLFLAIAGVGGIGYLLLGVWSGSWLSVVFVFLPIVVALAVGGTAVGGSSASETPLYVSWTFLTIYFFSPAWLFGLLISFVLRSYGPTTQ